MLTILGITGPIFILIAIGFAAVRSGTLARNEIRALGTFVINFALPALLFKAMAGRNVDELLKLDLLVIYALGSLLVVAGVIGVACLIYRRSLQAAAILAMGMAVSNSAYIGFPIAQQLIGPAASTNLAIYAVVETLIMLPLLMSLAELGGDSGRHWARVLFGILGRLLKNPMFVAIVAGQALAAELERQAVAHQDGDAIEPLLPMPDRLITDCGKFIAGEAFILRFDFLQARDVGPGFFQPFE